MYALKSPKQPNPQPSRSKRVASRAKSRQRSAPYRAIAYETAAKLGVNVVLSVAAIMTLVHLIPYRSAQEVKLQELNAAVKTTGNRVQQVQSKFSHYFDPNQARESMQELTDRIDPARRQVVWQNSSTQPTEQPKAFNPVQQNPVQSDLNSQDLEQQDLEQQDLNQQDLPQPDPNQ